MRRSLLSSTRGCVFDGSPWVDEGVDDSPIILGSLRVTPITSMLLSLSSVTVDSSSEVIEVSLENSSSEVSRSMSRRRPDFMS